MRFFTLIFIFCSLQITAQSWYPMNNGVIKTTGAVIVSGITFYQGRVTIGGNFKKSNSTVLNGTSYWNGNQWLPLGIGVWIGDGTVADSTGNGGFGLTEYNGKLFSAGIFNGAGGTTINSPLHSAYDIANWDGSDWFPISPPPLPAGVNSTCTDIFVYKDNLYLGGFFGNAFDSSGNNVCAGIAKWNDTVFSAVGQLAGNFPPSGYNAAMAFTEFNNNLIAGGYFTSIDGSPYGTFSGIASWNDTVWSPLSTGLNDAVFALTVFNGELYAGGKFTATGDNLTLLNHVAKWDGTQWLPVGEGLNDTVLALCVDSLHNKLIAGGKFSQTGLSLPAKHLAEWNGLTWQEVGGGTNDDVWALFAKDSCLYVGGTFTQVGAITANSIATWGSNPVGINESHFNNEVLNIYPNPATNQISIEFELAETKNTFIEVKNILGQTIKTIANTTLSKGTNKIELNLSDFANGIYFIQLHNDSKVVNKKFTKQ
jgi:hypothetical protein